MPVKSIPKTSSETSTTLWVEKYRPKNLREVIAGKKLIETVVEWAKGWEMGVKQKPLLLAGPPGVGKTSLAHAIAGTFGWEIVELNASDQRNWQIIKRIVGESAFNETISDEGEFFSSKSGKLKLIILDEVDNIHKKEDAGGEGALIRLLKKKPKQPIVLTANDPYNLSTELRNLCVMINFKRIDKRSIIKVLKKICDAEGIKADRAALEIIAENAGGDLRAAINDLQAIAEGKSEIRKEDVVTGKRTQELDIFKVMVKIFKTDIPAYNDVSLLNESPEDFIMWIDENVPLEYKGRSLFKAYLILSRADVFLGRVKRRQYYRLWKYATYLMSCGVQQAKDEKRKGFTKYRRPAIWQLLFLTKKNREVLKNILKKIGKRNHTSGKKAKEMLPLIKLLMSENIEIGAKLVISYEFNIEEVEFLTNPEKAREIFEFIEKAKKSLKNGKEASEAKAKEIDSEFGFIVEKESKKEEIPTETSKTQTKKKKTSKRGRKKGESREDNKEIEIKEETEKEEKGKKASKKDKKGKNVTLDFFM